MAKTIKKYSKVALIIGLSVTLVVMYLGSPSAKAGTLSSREVKISDSRPSQTSVYYDFLATKDAAANIACIKMDFCDEATGGCTAPTGMDTVDAAVATTTGFVFTNLDGNNWVVVATTSNSVTASTTSAEDLGTSGSWVIGGITNPSASTTYFVQITTYTDTACSSASDTGTVAYAIIFGVTVTAEVAETLNVTVNASSCTALITGGTATSSATTTIGFGTVSTEAFYNSCQRLDIGTNGTNGYTATIRKTQLLTSGSDTIPDGGCDQSPACTTTTAETWGNAANNGFSYCMKDETLNGAQVADVEWATEYCGGGSQSFMLIDDSEPGEAVAIMQSGSATSTNQAWVGYRLSVDDSQIAGAYSTVIIYVVTPNY